MKKVRMTYLFKPKEGWKYEGHTHIVVSVGTIGWVAAGVIIPCQFWPNYIFKIITCLQDYNMSLGFIACL